MTINEILKKIASGEQLTAEETAFAGSYDPDKAINDTAAKARRKAETELGRAQAEVERLTGELETLRNEKDGKENIELGKLRKQVETLTSSLKTMTEENARSKAEAARITRENAIAAFAAEKGIKPAKGIKEATFAKFFREAVGETDLADAESMEKVVSAFREDFAGIIEAGGVRTPSTGIPAKGGSVAVNPFKKETRNLAECLSLINSNPTLAKSLAIEAGDPLAETIQ